MVEIVCGIIAGEILFAADTKWWEMLDAWDLDEMY